MASERFAISCTAVGLRDRSFASCVTAPLRSRLVVGPYTKFKNALRRWLVCGVSVVGLTGGAVVAKAEVFDSWADEVIAYTQGSNGLGGYADPAAALGEPSHDTGFAGAPEQVTSFNPAWMPDQLVSIGAGGELVVRFDQPVLDNPLGVHFGIDLLIFGNALLVDQGGVVSEVHHERGRVQVSQTGEPGSWREVVGVFADDAFPTEGYTDASDAFAFDGTAGSDFTVPVDPAFDPVDKTYQQVLAGYNGSGGGTGVDISVTGLGWIQYVRVYQDAGDAHSTEVDAFADVVPEPSGAVLLGLGACALLRWRGRRGV